MRCNCCDRALTEKEVIFNPEIKTWELCTTCLEIALDAAYSGDFRHEDDAKYVLDEEDGFDSDDYYAWTQFTDREQDNWL